LLRGNDRLKKNPTTCPAAYPHVLTVGALDLGLGPEPTSGSGPALDLVAPGEAIPDIYRVRVKACGRTLRLRNTTKKSKTYYLVVRAPDTAPRTGAASPYALKLGSG
jgi:hypothetical protein